MESPESGIRHIPFFRTLDRVDVARIVGTLERVYFHAGTLIFAEGTEADALYILESGRVGVRVMAPAGERMLAELAPPAHFGELGLLLARRTASTFAITDVSAWKLPRVRFEQLVRDQAGIGLAVATALAEMVDQRSRERAGAPRLLVAPRAMGPDDVPSGSPPMRRVVGVVLAVGVPVALWGLKAPGSLTPQGWHVSLILLGAAISWLLEPVPDFVTGLAMVTAWGVAGLVPLSLLFSGFASSAWLIALGALGLAVAMTRSGLQFRLALVFLRTFPATHFGQVLALLVGGIVVTPLVPLALARVATIVPLTQELAQGLGYPPRSRASAGLAFAGLIGYGLFSSVFLTGLAMNFFVVDLLPKSDQLHFDWLTWLISAAPAGGVILIGSFLILLLLFRPEVAPRSSASVLQQQRLILGPLSRHELVTIGALAVLLVGLLLAPLLHIDNAWPALGTLILVIMGGVLDRDSFRTSIDWGFLILFGVLLGTAGVLRSVGVDRWIGAALIPLARTVQGAGPLVILLAAGIIGCRLVLPWIPATLLLSLALVPAASLVGLSPWVVGFVVLMAANTWLHPGQSDFLRLMREGTRGGMFTAGQGGVVGIALALLTLAALAASVPYWRAIGILVR